MSSPSEGPAASGGAAPHPWLSPLPFGDGALPNRILPGPMEGVTTGSFCAIMTRLGLVRCWVRPFVRVSTAVPRVARLREKLDPFLALGVPVVVQVMGTDVRLLAGLAQRLVEAGAAGVDLNCACPSPTVIGHGAGGERLRDPDWIAAAVTALRGAVGRRGLSVKLRSGYDEPAEMDAILPAAASGRPDFMVLHFRTVREAYRPVRGGLERLSRARAVLPEQILLASGDLFTAADALAMYGATRLDGVAPARGLLQNPWLLRDIEAACAGQAVPTRGYADRLGFLAAVAESAGGEEPRRPGFVLELARHLVGRESALFGRLAQAADAATAAAVLRQAMGGREAP